MIEGGAYCDKRLFVFNGILLQLLHKVSCLLVVVIMSPLLYGYNGYQDVITIKLGLSSGYFRDRGRMIMEG